jgi:tyrosinase
MHPKTRMLIAIHPTGLPYWFYPRFIGQPPETWAIFDDSDTSLSGNGDPTNPSCTCVTGGPFKDLQVNLGPVQGGHGCSQNPQDDGLGYNPRCLERNFQYQYLQNMTYENVTYAIQNFKSTYRRSSIFLACIANRGV